MDRARAREIVRLASTKTKAGRQWLFRDEFGTWEKTAGEYLEKTADKAVELGLTPEKVNDEIATMLAALAVGALLERAKKGAKR